MLWLAFEPYKKCEYTNSRAGVQNEWIIRVDFTVDMMVTAGTLRGADVAIWNNWKR